MPESFLAHQAEQHAGVDVSAARSHHQPFEGRHSHARLDAAPVLDRGDTRAVAQMARQQAQVAQVLAEVSCGARGDPGVAGSVEAVAPDAVLLRELQGERVGACPGRQCGVKGSVEDRRLGKSRQQSPRNPDARQGRRVVEGRQGRQRLDGRLHVVVDPHRIAETLAAMHHAVSDRGEVRTRFAGQQVWQYRPEGRGVVGRLDCLPRALAEA
jgi:hypothetical protein